MINRINNILEGEIVSVQKPEDGEDNSILYTCRVQFPDGNIIDVPNCNESSFFGGIGDYTRRRARSRKDAKFKTGSYEQADLDASVGERVYLAFVAGSINNPVIIAYKQHPNQVDEFEDPDEDDPNYVSQYNGLRETIDADGNWRLTRKGAPEVSFAPKSSGLLGGLAGAAAGAALGALAGAVSETFDGDDSPALKPQGKEERLILEILEKALFRIRDPEGGVIEVDHDGKKGIYISDNDYKSSEDVDKSPFPESQGLSSFDPSMTDAEFIWLNREDEMIFINARDSIQIHSANTREDTTDVDYSHIIGGNSEHEIEGNEIVTITGSSEIAIEGDKDLQITGSYSMAIETDYDTEVAGAMTVAVTGDMELKSQAKMTLYSASGYDLKTDDAFTIASFADISFETSTGGFSVVANKDITFESSTGGFSVTASIGDIEMVGSGNAAMKLSTGKVAIGGSTAELLDLFDQTLAQIDMILTNIQALTVVANLGFPTSPPVNTPAFLANSVQINLIKTMLATIKGTL